MWEARHGFPVPTRSAGGHRRYRERDVERVRSVLRHREDGLSLSAAIGRAVAAHTAAPASIFAGLASRRPDLQPMTLTKRSLLALTRAVEDEQCARASPGVLIGSFQRERFYRQSEDRWRELARTARVVVALADFARLRERRGRPIEVPVGREHPLAREWAIVWHAPDASACLASWEIPASRHRRFEVLWSPEPEVALAAVEVAVELIEALAPEVATTVRQAVAESVAPSSPELRAAVRQAHRMLAYLSAGQE
jgi:DICT domain-containing protein